MKTLLINDNFQNYKRYGIPKAQLVIADIPYNIGVNAYGSNPEWYIGGDNKNGESDKAGKANMKIVGATEYALILYRDKLPKFNNHGKMVYNWMEFERDSRKNYPKIHPTQKPVAVLKKLIMLFADPGDVVIDPCAGSGATLRACMELDRSCYGFEISKKMCREAEEKMLKVDDSQMSIFDFLEGGAK